MKRIHSLIEYSNKLMPEKLKTQKRSGGTEPMSMIVQCMYLKLQVMERDNPVRKSIIKRMVQTTLVAEAAGLTVDRRNARGRRRNEERYGRYSEP